MEKKKDTKKNETNLNEYKNSPTLPMVGNGATQEEADASNRAAAIAQSRDALIDKQRASETKAD